MWFNLYYAKNPLIGQYYTHLIPLPVKIVIENGFIKVKDSCTKQEEHEGLLETVFCDGKLIKETSLQEIRTLLHGSHFSV